MSSKKAFREKIKRRAILMEIGGFRPPEDPKTSRFGKVNLALPGEAWPVSNDRPMMPLAQVNLTELPFRPPRLEDIEFLAVFIDPDDLGDVGSNPNGAGWCVRAYPSLTALIPLAAPENLQSELKALPMRPAIIEADYPTHDDIVDEIPGDLSDSYEEDFPNVYGFKLGGWPTLIQGEISWSTACNTTPEFVFQIDSTEKGRWSWGDGGVGYFGRGTAPGHENEWFFAWDCH